MTATTRGPRLLIYSQDGLGLGHLRRTTLLASAFLEARPGASVLTVSDSPMGQFFSTSTGHDYLKLPSIRKVGPGDWRPVSMSVPFRDVRALRRTLIRAAAEGFRPDVLLVDHMPHGAMGELLPALEGLPRRVRRVLGLRDIVDAPPTVRRRWKVEGALDALAQHYDDVLVYGSREVFDVARQYGWPADVARRVRYCGYVCSPPSSTAPSSVRRRLLRGAPDSELVVAMAGGGADGHALFENLLRAVPALTARRPCRIVVVTGPFLPEAQRRTLRRLAHGRPVRLIPSVGDALSYIAAADLVVAMAGYNTTAEILGLARRALLVPRAGPSAEQRMRASRFAGRGWVRWLSPESLSPDALASTIVEALASPRPVLSDPPDLRGRDRAVGHLVSALEDREAPADPVLVPVNGTPRSAVPEELLGERP
jgi:predicted glycosyltransferase